MKVVVLALALTACLKTASDKAKALGIDDYWPHAPVPTWVTDAPLELHYKPVNITGYRMTCELGSPPGKPTVIAIKIMLALGFQPGKTPTERDAYLRRIDLVMNASGKETVMKLEHDKVLVGKGGEATTYRRGEPGPFDVARMLDVPFETFDFGHDQAMVAPNADHPFNAIGNGVMNDALVLFPDLPRGAIEPGYTWTTEHEVVLATFGSTHVTYTFRYDGESTCPSAAAACAVLSFTAAAADMPVETNGEKFTLGYGFAGRVYFDNTRGTVDESRARLIMDVKSRGQILTLTGLFVIEPDA